MLLDVELYSEEYQADMISIWMDEMGLASNPAMRNIAVISFLNGFTVTR